MIDTLVRSGFRPRPTTSDTVRYDGPFGISAFVHHPERAGLFLDNRPGTYRFAGSREDLNHLITALTMEALR